MSNKTPTQCLKTGWGLIYFYGYDNLVVYENGYVENFIIRFATTTYLGGLFSYTKNKK